MEERTFRTTSADKKGIKKRIMEQNYPLETESGLSLDKWQTLDDLVDKYIDGEIEIGDIEDGVSGGIQNASSVENVQKSLEKKLSKEFLRYIKAENRLKRGLQKCKPLVFCMSECEYRQCPKALVVDLQNRTVETIRYKAGMATGLTKGIKNINPDEYGKLEKFYDLYADRCYVLQNIKKLVPEFADGKMYTIISSMYFMKKTTDKKTSFDPDFFEGGGNSVISLTENHRFGETEHPTELDDKFHSYMEKAINEGFDCNEPDDCRYCNYSPLCQYTKAPVKQERKEVKNEVLGTPSPQQQITVDEFLKGSHQCLKLNAGAGSGKTYVLKYIVVKGLMEGRFTVKDILLTSFTNASVGEIKDRVIGTAASVGITISPDDLQCFTFDGLYYNIVCHEYQNLGFPAVPALLQADVQKQYVEELVGQTVLSGIDYGRMDYDNNTGIATPFVVNAVSRAFDTIQTFHIDPDKNDASDLLTEKLSEAGLYQNMSDQTVLGILELYKDFDKRLRMENLITFSHLQGLMDQVLEYTPDYLSTLGYKYIMVDEFQDSNQYQVDTIRKLMEAEEFQKLLVVGDDNQAIYSFRDTTPEYIIHLDQYLGQPVKDLYLLQNRRSVPEIIDLANQYIALNEERLVKDLVPTREHGKPVSLQGYHSKMKERDAIVSEIKKKIDAGTDPSDICVIAAKRAPLADIGTKLSMLGIPWVSKNPMNLLANSKVKAALSLADAFFEPDVTCHYFDYLVAKYDGIIDDLDPIQLNAEIAEMKEEFANISDYDFEGQRYIFHEYLEKLLDVEEDELYEYFLSLLYNNKTLPEELEYSRIFKKYGGVMEKKMDQNYKGVCLVTAHSSKGLEWPVCFVSISDFDSSRLHKGRQSRMQAEIEEKRRLLFVAMTRAKDELFISGVYIAYGSEKEGYTYNQFLNELYTLKGMTFDPVDHEKEAAKAAKAAGTKALRSAKRKASTGSEMSEEEKAAYDKFILGCSQMTLDSLTGQSGHNRQRSSTKAGSPSGRKKRRCS